jgi:thymidine kinase
MDFSDGKLDIILGTMFSGKTSYMISKISFFADLGFKILYLNIEFDNRCESAFSTHNPFINAKEYQKKGNIQKNVTMIKTKNLQNLPNIDYNNFDIVIIDEAHFFEDLVEFTKKLLDAKKYVIVGSLIADYKGNKFGNVYDLIPLCDDVIRLQAYCGICATEKRYRVAIYSKRMSESEETIEIGGSEKYVPVCREHYSDNNIKTKTTENTKTETTLVTETTLTTETTITAETAELAKSIKKHIIIENTYINSIDFTNISQYI